MAGKWISCQHIHDVSKLQLRAVHDRLIKKYIPDAMLHMGLDTRKPVFGGVRTTKAQASLRIHAGLSAPLLFANQKVPYQDLPHMKFQFSS